MAKFNPSKFWPFTLLALLTLKPYRVNASACQGFKQ